MNRPVNEANRIMATNSTVLDKYMRRDKPVQSYLDVRNLRRAIMVLRENRHRDDDTLAPVWYEELVDGGPPKPIDRAKWETVKDRFYEQRGWSLEKGWPKREKLESLGMKSIADGLEQAGKLG